MLTLFLAKFFGLYFMIMGIFMLTRKETMASVKEAIKANPALLMITGVLQLMIGLILVITHSIFAFSLTILITLIGYLCLFGGIMRIFFPGKVIEFMERSFSGKSMDGWGIGLIVVGVILLFYGFV